MRKRQILPLLVIIGIICIFYNNLEDSTEVISIIVKTPTLTYKVINMNDRKPSYRLVTSDGKKPYADGDRAQGTVVAHLRLEENCKRDPSLIVIDVGAFLGDFGLYAAACGCQVYFFEVQPAMVDLIQTSITLNHFSASRIHLLHKAVSNLPSNSYLTFNIAEGNTRATNGSLNVTTIRLDHVQWPSNANIFLLKIDVEGFELNVLRSAENLFRQKRIHHLIFEYTAYWTDRAEQKDLLPFVDKILNAQALYALDRTDTYVYGPLNEEMLEHFHENHVEKHLQTDIYATFVNSDSNTAIKARPYEAVSSLA